MLRVAVVGVSGYLGGLITRSLEFDPNVASILGLDIFPPKHMPKKLVFRKADVRHADFRGLFQGVDVVYHLAFIVEPPKALSMREIDEINIEGSRRVFEGAMAGGVRKIIYASSVMAYGAHPDSPVPLIEESPLRPNSDWYYSKTKGAVEAMLNDLQKRHLTTIVIRFRPSIFLGPTINNSIGKGLSGRVLFCLHEDPKIDLAWDEDIAEAFRLALYYDCSDVFNLTGGGPLTTREMGLLLGKRVFTLRLWWLLPVCRFVAKLGLIPEGYLGWLAFPMRYPVLVSTEKAKDRLGWHPKHDAAQTLIRFAESRGLRHPPAAKNGSLLPES